MLAGPGQGWDTMSCNYASVQLITFNWTHVKTLKPVVLPKTKPAAAVPASRQNDGS